MDNLNVERVTANDEIGRIIHENMLNEFCSGYVLLGEDRTCMPEMFLQYVEPIKKFEVKDDDVWVMSYPKTGTTWTQEMVWMIANNLNFKGGESPLIERFPFLEFSGIMDADKMYKAMNLDPSDIQNSLDMAENQKSPRFIKTHLPYSFLPDQITNGIKRPKIIYVWRNPKDACVSFYHHGRLIRGWTIDLESFTKVYMAGKATYGSIWKHIFSFWNHRSSPNILYIKYEDMKTELPSVIRKVAKFLEKDLTEDQIQLLTKHLSFESMKNNKAVNEESFINRLRETKLFARDGAFIRSGAVGKYKEELTSETVKKIDEWIKENVLETSLEQEYNFNL